MMISWYFRMPSITVGWQGLTWNVDLEEVCGRPLVVKYQLFELWRTAMIGEHGMHIYE